ncbi:MAG: MBL fold metallo-hydrolase [Chloroflexi bacterium]|nr:MBL fold metallo-hydrolase [Chloroflexota bacterium]MBU1749931.1 MBL fold metallo-hydrolase [Chloroflexota bacterium]
MFKIMDPAPTGPVAEHVYAVKDGMVSMFILTNGESVIAIDAGNGEASVRAELQKLPISPESVTHLFLTHSDGDHVGGLACFPNAHVYLSRDEEQMIDGTTARFFGRRRNRSIDRPYTLLDDGEVVTVGHIAVRAIATPGHTPGAMSYLVDGHVLFTGDTLRLRDGRAQTFIRWINMDTAAQKASIHKLARLQGVTLLCTAHTGCTANWDHALERWRVGPA